MSEKVHPTKGPVIEYSAGAYVTFNCEYCHAVVSTKEGQPRYGTGTAHGPGRCVTTTMTPQDIETPPAPDTPQYAKDWDQPPWVKPEMAEQDILRMCEDFNVDFHVGTAVVYLLRAGKKPGEPYVKELEKAAYWIKRRLQFEERKAKFKAAKGAVDKCG